jgi:hypothetical protein
LIAWLLSAALAVEPSLLETPELRYPAGLDVGEQIVLLRVRIDETGRVLEVTVLEGEDAFVDVVVEALPELRFAAVVDDGAPLVAEFEYQWLFPEQPFNVEGLLLSAGQRDPLQDVALTVGDRSVRTDQEGKFAIRNLSPGEHHIRTTDVTVRLPETTFSLTDDDAVQLELWAVPQQAVDEVVGVYRRQPKGAIHRTIDRDEVLATPGSIGDPIRALHSQPGLARVPLDAGWLIVRGGSYDDTGLFVDGVPVPLIFHLGGFTSILHPELVDEVRFYPNAYPARLGNAISGAVDLTLRDLPDRAVVSTGASLVFAHAYTSVPLGGKRAVAVAARRSYLDAVLTAAVGPEGARIAPRFWDFSGRYQSSHMDVLVLGLSDTIDAPTGVGAETVEVLQNAVQVQAHLKFDVGEWTFDAQPWLVSQARRVGSVDHFQRVRDLTPGLRAEVVSPRGEQWRFQGGVETSHLDYSIQQDRDIRHTPVEGVHPYVQLGTGEQLSADIGVRGEGVFAANHLPLFAASPRGTVAWQVAEPFRMFVEAGRYHQVPNHLILLGFPDGDYLPLEASTGISLGTRTRIGPLSIDIDGYHRSVSHLSEYERDGSVGQLFGRAFGVETLTRLRLGPVRTQVLYQMARSELQEEAGDEQFLHPLDQRHRLEVSALASLPRNWTLAVRFRAASGYLAPEGVTEGYDLLRDQMVPLQLTRRGRMAPFSAADIKVAHRFTLRKARVDVSLDLQNAYNRRIPELLIDGIDGSTTGVGFGLPILPIFGVDTYFWPARQRRDATTSR